MGRDNRFLYVRHSVFHSPQFSALSSHARSLFWELHGMYNGKNRDTVFLSVRDAADRLGLSCLKATCAAFDELVELGFLRESMAASFRQKYDSKSRARAWHLLWIGKDGNCSGPEFLPHLDLKALDKRQRKREQARNSALKRFTRDTSRGKFTVEDSTTLAARQQLAVEESSTLETGNDGKLPIRLVEDSTTQICYHGVRGDTSSAPSPPSAWWASVERCMARGNPDTLKQAA